MSSGSSHTSHLEFIYPQRRQSRLKDYDYTASGAYFFTVCTYNRACILGEVVEHEVILTPLGMMVESAWQDVPNHYQHVRIDQSIVMPNHIHGIVRIELSDRGPARDPGRSPTHRNGTAPESLAAIVGSFKARVTRQSRRAMMLSAEARLWQRGFYDHAIRSDRALERIREYIVNNPAQWHLDAENPVQMPK